MNTRLTNRATPAAEFRRELDARYEAKGTKVYRLCACHPLERGRGWCAYRRHHDEWVAVLPTPEAAAECARLANESEAVKA